jgi:hypothetical protein
LPVRGLTSEVYVIILFYSVRSLYRGLLRNIPVRGSGERGLFAVECPGVARNSFLTKFVTSSWLCERCLFAVDCLGFARPL